MANIETQYKWRSHVPLERSRHFIYVLHVLNPINRVLCMDDIEAFFTFGEPIDLVPLLHLNFS